MEAGITPIQELPVDVFARVVEAIGWEQVASVARTDDAIEKIAARLSERARLRLYDAAETRSGVDEELALALYQLTLEHLSAHGSSRASSIPSA